MNQADSYALNQGGFDGSYTYFASQGFVYGSSISNWKRMKESSPGLFIPSVGPGYDDSPVRPWNGVNTKSRNNGNYYRELWKAALQLKPEIISITSFNEWHEGTQIETAVKKQGYDDYGRDPDMYLKITKEMVKQMNYSHVCNRNKA